MFCYGQAQMVSLQNKFWLFADLRCHSSGQRPWDSFLQFVPKSPPVVVMENVQISLFSCPLVLQPEVLVDQEWRSKLHIFYPDTNTRTKLVNARTHLHYPSQKRWLPGVRGLRKPPRRARCGAPTCSHPRG